MPDGFTSFGGLTETGVVPAKTHAIERPSFSYCIPRLSLSVKGSFCVPRASCASQANTEAGEEYRRMSAFGGKADMSVCGMSAFAVAIGGKADIVFCSANVCF